jgi:hypothetical protein
MYVEAIFVVIAALIICCCMGWSIRRENGGQLIFSPFLMFCLNEIACVWPAAIYARQQGISEDSFALLAVISITFAFVAGYVLVREWSGWTAGPYDFWSQPMHRFHEPTHVRAIITCGVLFFAAGVYLYQGIPPAITGLHEFLSSGYRYGVNELTAASRLELTKGHYFGGEYRGQGVARLLMRHGWPYLTAIAALIYFQRRKITWKLFTVVLATLCFVFIAGDGTRGPFLWSMIAVLVAVSYHIRIKLRTCVLFGCFAISALLVMSLTQKLAGTVSSGTLLTDGIQKIVERIFIGNTIHTIHAIEFVRSGELPLRWGGIQATDVCASLPFVNSDMPFAHELFLLEHPDAKSTHTTFANTSYLGIIYAEVGWGGSLIVYFILGAMTAKISQILYNQPKTLAATALVGMTALYIGQLNRWSVVSCVIAFVVLTAVSNLYRFSFSLAFYKNQRQLDWRVRGTRQPRSQPNTF